MSKWIQHINRKEDMSPNGHLRMMRDADGDVIIEIMEDDGTGFICKSAAIEFCTIGSGGGGSPKTFKALLNLMEAMEEDNNDPNSHGREVDEH